MKKRILLPLLLLMGHVIITHAQKNVYDIFYVYESPGIVDTTGKEIWQPNGKFSLTPRQESTYWVFEGRDTMDVLFNKRTGERQAYTRIDRYGIILGKSRYLYIRDTAKAFLLNDITGRRINFRHIYESTFRKENNYLFAYYQEFDTALKQNQKRVDIFENNEDMKPVLEAEYGRQLLLYKAGTIQKIYTDEVPFDAVVFSNGNRHNLYDKNMKRVKRFVLGKARTLDLVKEATQILGYKVEDMYTTLHPDEENNTQVMLQAPPERFFPMLDTDENKDGTTTVVLKESNTASRLLFTTAQRARIYGRDKVEIEHKESYRTLLKFEVDLSTGRNRIPAKYLELTGVKMK